MCHIREHGADLDIDEWLVTVLLLKRRLTREAVSSFGEASICLCRLKACHAHLSASNSGLSLRHHV